MQVKEDYDVGVIIARFQVPALHDAHKQLIQTVLDRHDKVILFLGLSPVRGAENSLDFEARKQMVLQSFPKLNVLYIKDMSTDEAWSDRLDEMIDDLTTPSQSVMLYGGRDSFQKQYTGRYPTKELTQDVWVSGTEIRKGIASKSVKADPAFREGVIWAMMSRFPTVYTTVDIAIFADERHEKILLGRKPTEKKFRFIGGFSTPNSPSFEIDARREVKEETGLDVEGHSIKYLGSYKIDDWRYRSEQDKIKTLFYLAYSLGGVPKPGDDIAEVRWFKMDELTQDDLVETHHNLYYALQAYLSFPDTDTRN